jgi:hypothetical protein
MDEWYLDVGTFHAVCRAPCPVCWMVYVRGCSGADIAVITPSPWW